MLNHLESKHDDIARLCRKHGVHRLALFGSALHVDFDPERSDLDFLVRFQEMSPTNYAESYFGLMEDLQELLGRPIDLVTEPSLANPWLRREVERHQSVLYGA